MVNLQNHCISIEIEHKFHLQFLHDHETQESVESVQAEGPQRVLNLREESAVGHFLMRPQIVPSVQLVNVTRHSERNKDEEHDISPDFWHLAVKASKVWNNHFCADLLWIRDPQDFPAQASNKRGGFINRRILRNGNVGGLVDALPVLDLKRTSLNQH